MNPLTCNCSEEYGPCEHHGITLVIREGASLRTGDESTLQLCADLVECGAEIGPWGRLTIGLAGLAISESADNSAGGCGHIDDEVLRDALEELARELESRAPDLWVTHEDGYVITRPTDDCPLN